jgi:hypothetical protein
MSLRLSQLDLPVDDTHLIGLIGNQPLFFERLWRQRLFFSSINSFHLQTNPARFYGQLSSTGKGQRGREFQILPEDTQQGSLSATDDPEQCSLRPGPDPMLIPLESSCW